MDPDRFVAAIRGTSNWIEWWDDTNAVAMETFRVPGCGSVGVGFARIYDTLEVVEYPTGAPTAAAVPQSLKLAGSFSQQIASLVKRRSPAATERAALPSSSEVSIVGHSLGGALATLYALDNARTDSHNPLVCTFASPRVGDSTFAAVFNGLGLKSWRIANAPDLVPNVPPDILGFTHVGATEPRQVLRGGYLSWEDPGTGTWWQETWFNGNVPTFRNLGPIETAMCGRS